MPKLKQHEWFCWLKGTYPDKEQVGERIKASAEHVARNIFAKKHNTVPENVLVRIWKLE